MRKGLGGVNKATSIAKTEASIATIEALCSVNISLWLD